MRSLLSLIALSSLLVSAGTFLSPAQEVEVECTTSFHHYSVPDPTRRGMFISHFASNGAPQSIVTASDSDTTCIEIVPEDDSEEPPPLD